MLRNSHIFRASTKKENKTMLRWRVFRTALVLLLALSIGGTVGTAPAQAAPHGADTIINFNMDVSEIPSPICVNSQYHVDINTRVDRTTNLNGSQLSLRGGPGSPEILVKASSSDDSIASWASEEFKIQPIAGGIGTGHDYNALEANKEGQAILSLKPTIKHAAANGGDVSYPAIDRQIAVKKCKYNVVMRFQWSMSVAGFNAFAMGIADIDILPDEKTGNFKGNGVFDVINGAVFPGTPCSASLSGYHNNMHITGRLIDDELKLEFLYEPADNYITARCEDMTVSTTKAFDPTISAPEGASFPSNGGTVNRLTSDTSPPGRIQIIVTQIVE